MVLHSRLVAASGGFLALCLSIFSCSKTPADSGTDAAENVDGQDCSTIPQCEFACPDRTANPVDENGCTHTCECVARSCVDEPGLPRDGCVPPAVDVDGGSCSTMPQCEFACPDGTANPVDENGCTHTCECVARSCVDERGLPRDGCVPPAVDAD
jgi:hypothetical protein